MAGWAGWTRRLRAAGSSSEQRTGFSSSSSSALLGAPRRPSLQPLTLCQRTATRHAGACWQSSAAALAAAIAPPSVAPPRAPSRTAYHPRGVVTRRRVSSDDPIEPNHIRPNPSRPQRSAPIHHMTSRHAARRGDKKAFASSTGRAPTRACGARRRVSRLASRISRLASPVHLASRVVPLASLVAATVRAGHHCALARSRARARVHPVVLLFREAARRRTRAASRSRGGALPCWFWSAARALARRRARRGEQPRGVGGGASDQNQ